MDVSYYINGLLPKPSALRARQYLEIQNDTGQVILTDFGTQDVLMGQPILQTPVWQDIRMPMASLRPGASSANAVAFINNTRAYRFQEIAIQSLEFELQLPHGFHPDYGVRIHLHWTSNPAVTPAQFVRWGLETTVANIGQVFSQPSTTTTVDVFTTQAFQHVVTPLRTIMGLSESAVIVGRVFRDGPADTFGDTVYGISLDAHYVVQKLGSLNEF